MKWKKKVLLALLVVLIVIQFMQPNHNESLQLTTSDITALYNVPDSVLTLLKTACYDCHSNNTNYPWYANIQPAAWFMANHIKNGKENLNFTDFGSYSKRKQKSKLSAIANQVKDKKMPLVSYTLIHAGARLDENERNLIINWAERTKDSLKGKN